jgi:uncharacterized peroxidase-related enzyme
MFLKESTSPEATAHLEKDRVANGYVTNHERAWAWRPDLAEAFIALRKQVSERSTLTPREVAVLACTGARVLGDSYCSLAWGSTLAELAGPPLAGAVLRGADADALTAREAALKQWAEQVVRDPNGTTLKQIEALRAAGLSDREIFEATAYVAFRLAFSTVNDALGAEPDQELVAEAPPEVRAAVTYGRSSSNRGAAAGEAPA